MELRGCLEKLDSLVYQVKQKRVAVDFQGREVEEARKERVASLEVSHFPEFLEKKGTMVSQEETGSMESRVYPVWQD
jgi:hypothetical protein